MPESPRTRFRQPRARVIGGRTPVPGRGMRRGRPGKHQLIFHVEKSHSGKPKYDTRGKRLWTAKCKCASWLIRNVTQSEGRRRWLRHKKLMTS